MLKSKYRFLSQENGFFELYQGSLRLTSFKRENFRENLESCASEWGLSSKWIGSILRLFNQQYPLPFKESKRTNLDRLVFEIGDQGIVDHLRQKGLRVVKKINVPDDVLACYLEKKGYEVEGLIHDVYYSSAENAGLSERR